MLQKILGERVMVLMMRVIMIMLLSLLVGCVEKEDTTINLWMGSKDDGCSIEIYKEIKNIFDAMIEIVSTDGPVFVASTFEDKNVADDHSQFKIGAKVPKDEDGNNGNSKEFGGNGGVGEVSDTDMLDVFGVNGLPQQEDNDCGIFVAKHIEFFIHGAIEILPNP